MWDMWDWCGARPEIVYFLLKMPNRKYVGMVCRRAIGNMWKYVEVVCRRGAIGSGTGKAACFRATTTSMPVFLTDNTLKRRGSDGVWG